MPNTNIFFNDQDDNNGMHITDDLDLDLGVIHQAEPQDEPKIEPKTNEKAEKNDDVVMISKTKLMMINKFLQNIKENHTQIIELLSVLAGGEKEQRINLSQKGEIKSEVSPAEESGHIIEGVFDGENMIGPDGKRYSVPANYASKSKLIEGDIMKLTITNNGTFVYKQIGPAERRRVVGFLEQDNSGNFIVRSEGRKWRVLTASVTYYKGQAGDEVVVLVPKNGDSNWGSVDNIVRSA